MSAETFSYKGISAGKYIEGEIEALNQEEASYKLKEQKIIITNLIKVKKKKAEKEVRLAKEAAEREARVEAQKEEERRIADEAVALLAEQKAARDAKYAARKARKGKRSRSR